MSWANSSRRRWLTEFTLGNQMGVRALLSLLVRHSRYAARPLFRRFMVSTDDANVAADSVIISPKASGYLSEVLVDDNQAVRASQMLARIDDRDYRTALAGAQANVASAQAAIDNLEQKIAQQRLSIVQAQAVVITDQAALAFSQQQYVRYSGLARTGAATVQDSQQWQTD
jgi:membrane fusion protein, multidrug efflux system